MKITLERTTHQRHVETFVIEANTSEHACELLNLGPDDYESVYEQFLSDEVDYPKVIKC